MRLILLILLAAALLFSGCAQQGPTQNPPNSSALPSDSRFILSTGPNLVQLGIPRTVSNAMFYYSPVLASLTATEPWEGNGVVETSGHYDVALDICEMWYRAGPSGHEAIGYARSTDSKCRYWQKLKQPVLTDPQGVLMPYVFEKEGTYYMLAKRNMDGAFWLYKSTDKFNWTLAQPVPVLSPSSNRSAWDYEIHNPAILWQGEQGYLFYEGANGTHYAFQIGMQPVRWNGSLLQPSTPRSPQPLLPVEQAFWRWSSVGNLEVVAIPQRHAVMLIAGGMPGSGDAQGRVFWTIGCAVANESSDLANASSWADCPNFILATQNVHDADPSLIQTNFKKADNLILLYSWDQNLIHQAHANMTLGEFYDAQMEPAPGGGAAARQT